jgi:hypothetical protein
MSQALLKSLKKLHELSKLSKSTPAEARYDRVQKQRIGWVKPIQTKTPTPSSPHADPIEHTHISKPLYKPSLPAGARAGNKTAADPTKVGA